MTSAVRKQLGPVQLCSMTDGPVAPNSSACHPAEVTLVASTAMTLPPGLMQYVLRLVLWNLSHFPLDTTSLPA